MPPPPPFPCPTQAARRRAFTLLELLTVLAIVGILVSILIPVLNIAREAARSAECVQNLRSIGAAFRLYAADNHGLYPALRWRQDDYPLAAKNPSQKGWQIEINPYFDRTISTFAKLNESGDAQAFCPEFVRLYKGTPGYGSTNSAGYGMNANLGVADDWDLRFPAVRIPDPAGTILVGDSGDYYINTTTTWSPSASKPGGYVSGDPVIHGGQANYLFADGHVKTLSPDAALAALAHP